MKPLNSSTLKNINGGFLGAVIRLISNIAKDLGIDDREPIKELPPPKTVKPHNH